MNAIITNIKRFAVHDGDGIRTTVFFKGCPLKCVWCHNPEAISPKKQIAFYEHKCIKCGSCSTLCACDGLKDGINRLDRQLCCACGQCASICPAEAIEIFGTEISIPSLLEILLRDKAFYDESGGGVTLSGGECLMQADFCAELLKELKSQNINTAVDTCGFVSKRELDKVIHYTDTFLYDIKAIDNNTHIRCTGQSNELILDNLKYLDLCGKKIEIRIPYVPNLNSNEADKIVAFLKPMKNITRVRVLPYHNYAASKYKALGMPDTLPTILPDEDEVNKLTQKINAALNICVR